MAPARCLLAIKWHDQSGPITLFSVPSRLVRSSSGGRSRRSSGSLSGQNLTDAPQQVGCFAVAACRGLFDSIGRWQTVLSEPFVRQSPLCRACYSELLSAGLSQARQLLIQIDKSMVHAATPIGALLRSN